MKLIGVCGGSPRATLMKSTKILMPILSVKNTPFTFFEFYTLLNWHLLLNFFSSNFWGVERASAQKKSRVRLKLAEKSIFKVEHFLIAFFLKCQPLCHSALGLVTLAHVWYFVGVALFISAHSLGGPSPVLVLTGVWIYFNRPLMGSVCQQLPTCYSLPHTGWYTSANGPTVCLCANTWYTPGA